MAGASFVKTARIAFCCLGKGAGKKTFGKSLLLGFLLLAFLFSELLRYAQGTRLYGMTAGKHDSRCIALLGFLLLTFLFSKRKVREFCARTVAFPAHICYYCRIKTKF